MVHFKFGYTYERGDEKKLCHRKLSAKCQHSFAPRTRARARGGAHAAHFGGKMKIGQKYDFWKKKFEFGYTYKRGDEKKLCHRKLSAKCQHSFAPRTRARARGGAHAAHFGGKMKIGQKYDFWKKIEKNRFFSIFWRKKISKKNRFFGPQMHSPDSIFSVFSKNFLKRGWGLIAPPLRSPPCSRPRAEKKCFFSKKKWT